MRWLVRVLTVAFMLPLFTAAYCPEEPQLLQAMGFTPLVPPANLMVPGAVLAIEEDEIDGQKKPRFHMSCGPRASLSERAMVAASSTISQQFNNKTRSQWKMDVAGLNAVGINVAGSAVKSISAQITNAKVLSLSDDEVVANLPYRSVACQEAIQQRLKGGYRMTMVSSALVADLIWTIEWDEKINAKMTAKDRILEAQKIAAGLGGGHSKIGQNKIESRQIALGIKTDTFLLALTVPEMREGHEQLVSQAEAEKSGYGGASMQADVTHPDSPYTLPSGGTYLSPEISFDD